MRKIIIQKKFQIPILLMLAGLILMLLGNLSSEEESVTLHEPVTGVQETTTLDQEISQLLCEISGVKNAHVVITYVDSGEQVVEKDIASHTEKTHEEDGNGGNRVVEQEEQQTETVYVEDAQGNRHPFVKTETYGTVQGVAVVVNGIYDAEIQEKIIRVLEALLDVPTHKIQVVW